MALNPSPTNPHQLRNILLIGIVIGAVAALILSAVVRGDSVGKKDLNDINDRLAAIEAKLATPSPTPQPSGSPIAGSVTVSQINQDPNTYVGQTVDLTGKVSSAHQGVGFALLDPDGTFLWVHTNQKIPTGNATVKGKITALKDQLSQWKNEQGWPANDAALTAKLREEKAFIEADSVQ
jgi:gas vesicle protein